MLQCCCGPCFRVTPGDLQAEVGSVEKALPDGPRRRRPTPRDFLMRTGVPRLQENAPLYDPTVGLCLGS